MRILRRVMLIASRAALGLAWLLLCLLWLVMLLVSLFGFALLFSDWLDGAVSFWLAAAVSVVSARAAVGFASDLIDGRLS
jgi:hypothetical protein